MIYFEGAFWFLVELSRFGSRHPLWSVTFYHEELVVNTYAYLITTVILPLFILKGTQKIIPPPFGISFLSKIQRYQPIKGKNWIPLKFVNFLGRPLERSTLWFPHRYFQNRPSSESGACPRTYVPMYHYFKHFPIQIIWSMTIAEKIAV